MTWVRIDDSIFEHPKFRDLSKDAKLLFFSALALSAKYMTDGLLTPSMVRTASAGADADPTAAGELVATGLWEATERGHQIHDYLHYNLSSEQIAESRNA